MLGMGRRTVALAASAVVLVVLLLSHTFGRAEPTGDYRPDLPADALATGCFPLPGDTRLTFGYQVRHDGDVEVDGELRRRLVAQYDELDDTEALAAIVADFEDAGFVASQRPAPYDAVLRAPGSGRGEVVRVMVEALPDTDDDTLVRGTFELDLPVVKAAKDDAVCSDPKATKRWPQDYDAESDAHDRAR
ncbi:hypothetical protein F0U44_13975 [Nocardioides humilatus]|uniref:Uncharacterized protein n=1 Tax=Nocardioides humilatus TaxID=2607660 RepID=A0A5B1LH20_9ACTN|nr:hypothetical protein [Nocardioides humilatus]KAA1419528.1 hypothetical protein F0U44_13975 [Nocardioides humilatus]